MGVDYSLGLQSLRLRYQSGALTPEQLVRDVLNGIADDEHHCWITVLNEQQLLSYAGALKEKDPAALPLYGVPFAIKDNIDLAGVPTTAACPEFACTPARSAFIVQRLINAGAIPIGKTNMDQFATGLVGTRTPYGITTNPFNTDYISGGSSSGSAVAVSTGLVSFALGTDTAGSGRVPAAFNNIVGFKPTRGLISTQGVVPACRTLDCISIFGLGIDDLGTIYSLIRTPNPDDPWSRTAPSTQASARTSFRFGVPAIADLEFFGNEEYRKLFGASIEKFKQLGGQALEIDYQPFTKAAQLLYQGPWLAERYASVREVIENNPGAMHPVVRDIITPAITINAVDVFEKMYELTRLKLKTDQILSEMDFLLLPTAGTHYKINEVLDEPVKLNSSLGLYTNFMNLLDYSGLALPAGFTKQGLPFGITLVAGTFHDRLLLDYGKRYMGRYEETMGATGFKSCLYDKVIVQHADHDTINVVVCGAHMSGMALNSQLTGCNARLISKTRTAGKYRLFALAGGPPFRPGLVFDNQGGSHIEVEVWALPKDQLADFISQVPAPLGFGRVELEDGNHELGFICEPRGFTGAEEITHLGSWRVYMASKR